MVVMISESVPGPLRRFTLAVTKAVFAERGPADDCASGGASCPTAGGGCCANTGAANVSAAMASIPSVALSTLELKGMMILFANKRRNLADISHVNVERHKRYQTAGFSGSQRWTAY
jgi:hypothetical protein